MGSGANAWGTTPFSHSRIGPSAKRAAARKMSGGSLKSLKELSAGATYAVYYWAFSKDGFGTGQPAKPHKAAKPGKAHSGGWRGHHRLGN